MISADQLPVKIFADGADRKTIQELCAKPYIRGFTTNPTLMRKAGIADYELFAREVLQFTGSRPVSFEVFADEFDQMESQALRLASWGQSVYVKIPITNTRGESSAALVRRLSLAGVKLNVTALLTLPQVEVTALALAGGAPACVSVFAGRVADTGRDPLPLLQASLVSLRENAPQAELIWASPRELLNVVQAAAIGCHIITVTSDILAKLPLLGKDLADYSLDTVKMFRRDALASGFSLDVPSEQRLAAHG